MTEASKPKEVGLNIRMSPALRADIKRMAIDQSVTVQELVTGILQAAVERHKRGK